jgi:hypothetical protein
MGSEQSSGSLPLIAALGLAGVALVGCLAGVLGPALIPVVLAAGGIALVGGLHYWLWGQSITSDQEETGQEKD